MSSFLVSTQVAATQRAERMATKRVTWHADPQFRLIWIVHDFPVLWGNISYLYDFQR